jgi:hypothetical protein
MTAANHAPNYSESAVPVPVSHPLVPVTFGLAMKRRNPFAAWLGLPLITFGIYHYVWYYKIHREMAEFDRRRAVPTAGPMLVLLFLSWTVVAPFVSYYNAGNRIRHAQRAAGLHGTCSGGLGILLMIFFSAGTLYYQLELNKVVDSYAGVPDGTQVPLYV